MTANGFRINLYSSHKKASIPIEEANATLPFDAEKHTSAKTLRLEAHVHTTCLFLEVAEHLHTGCGLSYRIVISVFLWTPCEVLGRAECFIPPGESGIYDILAITADRDEASIWRVAECLRVDFTISKFP